jgi:ankyrin repeat protein
MLILALQDEIVEMLLAHPDTDVNIENNHRTTALILSSGNGNVRVLDLLISDARVEPNLVVRTLHILYA